MHTQHRRRRRRILIRRSSSSNQTFWYSVNPMGLLIKACSDCQGQRNCLNTTDSTVIYYVFRPFWSSFRRFYNNIHWNEYRGEGLPFTVEIHKIYSTIPYNKIYSSG